MEFIFYKCPTCGQIITKVKKTDADLICCGGIMQELVAITEELPELKDKHVPVITFKDNKALVRVGHVPHPMSKEHYLEWIAIRTNKGTQRKELKPGDFPKAEFYLEKGEEVLEIYTYCNLHSFWKKRLNEKTNKENCEKCKIKGLK